MQRLAKTLKILLPTLIVLNVGMAIYRYVRHDVFDIPNAFITLCLLFLFLTRMKNKPPAANNKL